jgi:protein-disulfide isomerase
VKKFMSKNSARTIMLATAAIIIAAGTARAADDAAKSAFTPAQKEEINNMIHDYLIKNPEVMMESAQKYQQNKAEQEIQQVQQNVSKYKDELTAAGLPVGGNPKGSKSVVEFFDYNCGYCKRALDDVVDILKEDKDVKVVFIDMPILSSQSSDAARWALASDKQGKYFEFHSALMKTPLPREKATYRKIAEDLKMDVAKLEKDAEEDKSIREQIEKNLELARNIGIHGTPHFIINGMSYNGFIGIEKMRNAVKTGLPDKK